MLGDFGCLDVSVPVQFFEEESLQLRQANVAGNSWLKLRTNVSRIAILGDFTRGAEPEWLILREG